MHLSSHGAPHILQLDDVSGRNVADMPQLCFRINALCRSLPQKDVSRIGASRQLFFAVMHGRPHFLLESECLTAYPGFGGLTAAARTIAQFIALLSDLANCVQLL